MTGIEASVVHQIPGRARIRVPRARGQADFLLHLKGELGGCPLVKSVDVSPVTGSILIEHEGPLSQVLEFANERHLLDVPPRERDEGIPPVVEIADSFGKLDERMRAASEERWGVGSVSVYGLAVAALYQVARGKILPPAGTLVFQAMTVFFRTLEADRKRSGRG